MSLSPGTRVGRGLQAVLQAEERVGEGLAGQQSLLLQRADGVAATFRSERFFPGSKFLGRCYAGRA